jgi:hypothetical protein
MTGPALTRTSSLGTNRPLAAPGAEPDFILYGNSLGLLVLEVKDWEVDQIGEATPHTFRFWTGDKEETRTNPDRQAKGYVNELMDLLKSHPEFRQGGGVHGGRLKIPMGRMVVFPHITRKDYLERGLDRIIAPAFPFPFNGHSGKEVQKLTALIYPIPGFETPKRQGARRERFQRISRSGSDQTN